MSETAETTERLDPQSLARSVDGFEKIAIRQLFRQRFDELAADGAMFMRALLFVIHKRDGQADPDAFRNSMLLPLGAVVARFADESAEDADAVAERDRAYANFVVGTGLSFTVDQFMALTVGQRQAIFDEANARGR